MATTLLPITSTLIVSLPDYLVIPEYQEKIRAKKAIIRAVIQLLRSKELELIYLGPKHETTFDVSMAADGSKDCTIINVNIIESAGKIHDFNRATAMLLKRFKRELQYNTEHILIDHTTVLNGKAIRNIEIYLKSREVAKTQTIPSGYTYTVNSLQYSQSA